MTGRELVQLRIDGVDVGAPTLPRNLVRAFRGDGAVHVAEVALVEPAVGARATAEFTVGECTSDQMVRTAMATLRQHGRSELALPTECGGMSIAVPGVARLEDLGAANASTSRFATDATELDVGSHVVTLGCQGTIVDLEVFVYHQIGGDRGQSRAIATNAAIGAAVGVAAIGPRRRWL